MMMMKMMMISKSADSILTLLATPTSVLRPSLILPDNDGWFLADKGFWGRLMVSSCTLVGDCRVRFLMRTPHYTLDYMSWAFSQDFLVKLQLFIK